MKNLRHKLELILVMFLLSSCGGDEATQKDTPAPESTFDPMVSTIDKARAVEDLSADRTEDLDKEIEKSQ